MEKIIQQQVVTESAAPQHVTVFYRITALWAICEAFLGGVLHALHLPGTGLFVGGAAVLCISLLAYHCPSRHAILKATVLVILIKGILSPRTPPGAYLAVFIQGGLGSLLFLGKSYFKVSCLLLGVLTQLQSALQRLVVMLIMFGADLYQVAHGFVNYILKKAGFAEGDYVLYVVVSYIGLHVLMGIFVGLLAGRLPDILGRQQQKFKQTIDSYAVADNLVVVPCKIRAPWKRIFSLLTISVAILLAVSLYFDLIVYNTACSILVRTVVIVTVWVWVVSPLLQKAIKRWSANKRSLLAAEPDHVLMVMPYIANKAEFCWASTSQFSLLKRLLLFPGRLLSVII